MKVKSIEYYRLCTDAFDYWQCRALELVLSKVNLPPYSFVGLASEDFNILLNAVEVLHKNYIEELEAPRLELITRPAGIFMHDELRDSNRKVIEAEYVGEPKLTPIEGCLNIDARTPVRFRLNKSETKTSTVEVDGKIFSNTERHIEYGEWIDAEERIVYHIDKVTLDLLEG